MSSDEDAEFDEDGNFRTHEDYTRQPSSDEGTDIDEDGFPIVGDLAIVGDGDFTFEGEVEPSTDYRDLFDAKRRKTAE